MVSYFPGSRFDEIPQLFKVQYWNNSMIAYYVDDEEKMKPYKKIAVLLNPTLEKKTYELDDYYKLLVDVKAKGEDIMMKNGIIPPLSVQILIKKE